MVGTTQQLKGSQQARGTELLEEISDRTFASLFIQMARLGARSLSLPADAAPYEAAVRGFMRNFGIPVTNLDISAQMYALFLVLSEPLSMMREDVSREYLLELIDMQPDTSTQRRESPHLSFGRGQRYASKGTYV